MADTSLAEKKIGLLVWQLSNHWQSKLRKILKKFWNKLAKNDYDLLVEIIRLDEPQEYIRRIAQHYSVYHHLYAD